MKTVSKSPSRFILPGLIFCFYTTLIFLPGQAFAQAEQPGVCQDVLLYAEDLFFNAIFELAIGALNDCLPSDALSDEERSEIFLLLARIYFADQKKPPAADALGNLFDLQPDFESASYLPPPFIEFAEQIREIHSAEEVVDRHLVLLPAISEEKKTNNKRWLLISGGGLFAVTAVAIMSSGRSNIPDTFPPPPGTPSSQ